MKKLNFKLTMLLTMCLAAQLQMEAMDAELRMEGVDADWRRETKFGLKEINSNMEKGSRYFNKARMAYERFIEPSLTRCLTDKVTKLFKVEDHDCNMKDANEINRLLMLYYDRCFQNFDNVNAVFKFLRSLQGANVFTDEDIERFRM